MKVYDIAKRKYVVIILIVAIFTLIGYLYQYYNSIHRIGELIEVNATDCESIEMRLKAGRTYEGFDVDNRTAISEIIGILNEVRVVPSNGKTKKVYGNIHKKNYIIFINKYNSSYLKPISIDIWDNTNIRINSNAYRVIGRSRLSELYRLTILSQAPGTIDQYYIDLIDVD